MAASLGVGSATAEPRPASFAPRPLSAFERQKAKLLLDTRLPCLGCHELHGSGGRIGPSLTDVRTRRSPSDIFVKVARFPMDDSTRDLITNYLLQHDGRIVSVATADLPVHEGPPEPVPGDAAALYARLCSPCHGMRGGGDGVNRAYLPVRPTVHASKAVMSARSDDALFDTIFAGGYIMNRSHTMPSFGGILTRDQIWALVRHIRSLCRCEGPAWSRDDSGTRKFRDGTRKFRE